VKLFGTDGIRGEAGKAPLDAPTLRRLGRLLGAMLAETGGPRRVVIGGDTRESTPELCRAVASGLAASGIAVDFAGVVPTPAVADLVLDRGDAAGISVSASHNPWRDNGVKIFGSNGEKWADEFEIELERRMAMPPSKIEIAEIALEIDPKLSEFYLARLARAAPEGLAGLSILLDCGNGAAHALAPRAFGNAGAKVEAIGITPDGRNINEGCGALHPEEMAKRVHDGRYDFGAAFDGDADRIILCDETGRILDGDDILWILARSRKELGLLVPSIVVGTVMSNFGLEFALSAEEIVLLRTPVGDRHVARMMKETDAILGGEPSGHIIQANFSTTGDGILTALSVAALVRKTGVPLSKLADLQKTPQLLKNVRVARRVPLEDAPLLLAEIQKAEDELKGVGRVLVRYSGTEPVLRVMVEGPDAEDIEKIAERLCGVATRELGVG
jgi:phosphoglucosamine mutase